MMDWNDLLTIFAAFFVVAASPGPAVLALATVSATAGRRDGPVFGAGLAVGLAFWGGVAATGLGAVLQTTGFLLTALKLIGGLYLLWLAYGAARAARQSPPNAASTQAPSGRRERWFWRGLVLNLSNPKAVFAWMAALSVGLGGDAGASGLILATMSCALIGLLIYAAYAAAFSLPFIMQGYARFRRWINGTVAALFAIFGVAMIRSAMSRSAGIS